MTVQPGVMSFLTDQMKAFSQRRSNEPDFQSLATTHIRKIHDLSNRVSYVFTESILPIASLDLKSSMMKILKGSIHITVVIPGSELDKIEETDREPIIESDFPSLAMSMKILTSGLFYQYLANAPIAEVEFLMESPSIHVVLAPTEEPNHKFSVVSFQSLQTENAT